MKKFILVGVMALSMMCLAKTVYVRSGLADYAGHNGTSWDLAYETIQQGVNAAASGDTVLVHAGVYDKGWGRGVPAAGEDYHWWGKARVNVNGYTRSLTIRSCKSVTEEDVPDAENTIIQGEGDPDGDVNGFGENAVRCIQVETTFDATNVVIFSGFTLRGGRTKNSTGGGGYGGALQCSKNANDACTNTFLVGCIITDCQASTDSIAVGGTFVRCQIRDTAFTWPACKKESENFYLAGSSRFVNCLFKNISFVNATNQLPAKVGSSAFHIQGGYFANCTFMNNRAYFWDCDVRFYNSLISTTYMNTGTRTFNRCDDSTTAAVLIAPTLGDYRVRKGSAAETTGDAQYLSSTYCTLPPEIDPYLDIDGNPIPKTGKICAGCCQTTVTPAAGKIYADDARVYFEDTTNTCIASGKFAYVWPTSFPTNYRIRATKTDNVGTARYEVSFFNINSSQWRAWPSWKYDDIYLAPPPDVASATKVASLVTSLIAYAKPGADSEGADGSYEHPYPTLQEAYDKYQETTATSYAVVKAFPGVYSTGDRAQTLEGDSLKTRLYLYTSAIGIRIIGMEGPEKTFITGAPDPDTGGNGPNATQLLAMQGAASVCGFTLTGGWSGSANTTYDHAARPIYSYGMDLTLSDCIITNNHGANLGVGVGRFERCLIADNYGKDAILASPILCSCIVTNNHLSSADGVVCKGRGETYWKTYCYNSTFVGDGVHDVWGEDYNASSIRQNHIVDFGGSAVLTTGTNRGNVYNGFLSYVDAGENVLGNPMLLSDGRLFAKSPALTAAVMTEARACEMQADFFGRRYTYPVDGKNYAGAIQEKVSGGIYIGDGAGMGGLAISGANFGYTAGEDFTGATISMAHGAHRPLAGLLINGETNLFSATVPSYAISSAQVSAGDVSVEPYYTTDWYVDAENGRDTNDGYAEYNAFKTLAHALTNAYLVTGDRVVALPGIYAEGTISNATTIVPARAFVKSGVTLISRDGAATTFIKGEASETAAIHASSFSDEARAGLGPEAIRGVFVDENALVKGFTITNGFTFGFGATGANEHGGYRCNGGNVTGVGTIEDCVLTGGKAFRGGGTYRTRAIRCLFDGNQALYGGGASSDAYHYNCISRKNVCHGTSNYNGFFYWRACENCTTFDLLAGPGNNGFYLHNALVLGGLGNWDWIRSDDYYHAFDGHLFTNCVFVITQTGNLKNATYAACIAAGGNCIVTNLEALVTDEDGRPVIGQNVAIDAGNAEVSDVVASSDFEGGQRVYNGAIDCGAYEADWRATYAADLERRVRVQTADPTVTETPTKAVRLVDTSLLTARVTSTPVATKKLTLRTTVSGGGTLLIRLNGETIATLTEGTCETRIPFLNPATDELACSYAGDGYADLDSAEFHIGFRLIIR